MPNFYHKYKKLENFLQQRFFYAIALLLIFIPLYPKFPLVNVKGTFVAVRLEDIIIFLVVLLWLVLNLKNLMLFFSKTIYKSFLLFWALGVLSLISALFITQTISPSLGILHYLRRIEYMSLFIVAATTLKSTRQIKMLIYVLLFVTILVIIYGFGQIYFNFPVISTTNREFSKGLILYLTSGARVNSTFAGHYDLAVFLSIVLMIISSLIFYFKSIKIKVSLFLLGISGFILLGLTAARVSFVATVLGLMVMFWLNNKKIFIILLFLLTIISVGVIPELRHRLIATVTVNILGGGGPKYDLSPQTITPFTPLDKIPEVSRKALIEQSKQQTTQIQKRYSDIARGEPINPTELGVDRSFKIRSNIEWPRALNAFYRNPFLGTGYSSISLATDNDYLRSLGELGLIGTFSLSLVLFIIVKKMLRSVYSSTGFSKRLLVAIVSSIFVFLATALFIDVLEASKIAEIFWLMLGISFASLDLGREETNVSN